MKFDDINEEFKEFVDPSVHHLLMASVKVYGLQMYNKAIDAVARKTPDHKQQILDMKLDIKTFDPFGTP